jgi:lipopolysaccharide transport system permease protein
VNLPLLLEFTKRDFTERYAGSVLGVLWTFIWPLVNIFIYTVIFSKIMAVRLPGIFSAFSYPIYLIAGIVPWTAFSNTVLRASSVFADKKHIISKIRIKLPLLPFYIVLSETIVFAITLLLYVAFLLLVKHPLTASLIFIPFIYMVQQIFAYSLGFLIAIFYVFLRDLREIISIVIQFWFWFTPIVYVFDILPDIAKRVFVYNPAFLFIDAYHEVFVFGRMPNFYHLIKLTLIGHGVLFLAYSCYKKLEKDIRDFL